MGGFAHPRWTELRGAPPSPCRAQLPAAARRLRRRRATCRPCCLGGPARRNLAVCVGRRPLGGRRAPAGRGHGRAAGSATRVADWAAQFALMGTCWRGTRRRSPTSPLATRAPPLRRPGRAIEASGAYAAGLLLLRPSGSLVGQATQTELSMPAHADVASEAAPPQNAPPPARMGPLLLPCFLSNNFATRDVGADKRPGRPRPQHHAYWGAVSNEDSFYDDCAADVPYGEGHEAMYAPDEAAEEGDATPRDAEGGLARGRV